MEIDIYVILGFEEMRVWNHKKDRGRLHFDKPWAACD